MSTTFYIVVYLIVSSNQVDIILNKVELDEYKNYKLGTIERKMFDNSPEALDHMQPLIDEFRNNHQEHEVLIDISAKNQGGWMRGLLNQVPTLSEVEAYARSKNYQNVNDEVFVRFCQDREIKNIARN